MAAFALRRKSRLPADQQPVTFVPMRAPARPLPGNPREHRRAERVAETRGDGTSPGTSLTLSFLIAGGIILAALVFWSGPERDASDTSVQQPDAAVPVP